MVTRTLNDLLTTWLQEGGASLRLKINEEFDNRQTFYPAIGESLSMNPIDMTRLAAVTPECWLLDRFKKIRFNDFMSQPERAQVLLANLIDDLPATQEHLAARINAFVDEAIEAGFVTATGSRDFAGAATLASLALTAVYPDRFVDYPSQKRWESFGVLLGRPMPELDSHGERIVWVASLAQEIAEQPTFRLIWPLEEPMWVVGALCWSAGRTD